MLNVLNDVCVVAVNACNGRQSTGSSMDFTNIQSLLNYTTSLPADELTALAGFEFGNEILRTGVEPSRWAEDANHLASLIHQTFENAGLHTPPLIGPDHYSLQGYEEVMNTLEKNTLSAVTYHDYPQYEPGLAVTFAIGCQRIALLRVISIELDVLMCCGLIRCMPAQEESAMVLQPSCLAKLDTTAADAARIVEPYGAGEDIDVLLYRCCCGCDSHYRCFLAVASRSLGW